MSSRRFELSRWAEQGNRHVGLERRPQSARHAVIAQTLAERLRPDASVVDFGCGLGQTAERLRELRPDIHVTLADRSEATLEVAARFVPGDVVHLTDDLPYPRGDFDAVIASHVIEHVERPVDVVRQLLAIPKVDDGMVVLAVPNTSRPWVLLQSLRRRNYANRGHVVSWDAAHWRVFLEEVVGADVLDYLGDDVQLFPRPLANRVRPLRAIERKAVSLVPWWSFSNIAVVRAAGLEANDTA